MDSVLTYGVINITVNEDRQFIASKIELPAESGQWKVIKLDGEMKLNENCFGDEKSYLVPILIIQDDDDLVVAESLLETPEYFQMAVRKKSEFENALVTNLIKYQRYWDRKQ